MLRATLLLSLAATALCATIQIGADSYSGNWNSIPASPMNYGALVGDVLQFEYSPSHNVWLMPSEAAYEACDFSGATELAGAWLNEGSTNLFEVELTEAGTFWFACEVGSHCTYNQKIAVTVGAAAGCPTTTPSSGDACHDSSLECNYNECVVVVVVGPSSRPRPGLRSSSS